MKKKVTIHDIARMLNLTASTVSRALNDHPKISDETKQLVKSKAQELGYKPNILASSLRTGKRKTIGLVVPRINRDFISNAIAGIENTVNKHGYQLIISQSEENSKKELLAIRALIDSRVAGILISVSAETNESGHLKAILDENIPLVQFDRVRRDVPTFMVVNNNYEIAYQVTQHLISKGAKNLVHFAGPRIINIYQERSEGYRSAISDNGLEFNDQMVFEPVINQDSGYIVTKELLRSGKKVDGIIAASDYSALGALLATKELKVKVPEEFVITGFANEPFTKLVEPSITSIDQHAIEMGSTAAQTLIDLIEGRQLGGANVAEIVIPCTLLMRQSSNKLQ